jgi:hypothetical protein
MIGGYTTGVRLWLAVGLGCGKGATNSNKPLAKVAAFQTLYDFGFWSPAVVESHNHLLATSRAL